MPMTSHAPSTRATFVQSLELAVPDRRMAALPSDTGPVVTAGEERAYVDAGSTVSFVGNLSVDRQHDVLNSTLLAQLAANKKFDREQRTQEWYEYYRSVLENLGWVVTNFGFQRYTEAGASLRLDKTALSLIGAIASGNELAVLTKALDVLKNADPDSKEATIFDVNGSTGENGNFQIASCSQDPSGNVQSAFGAFYFKASETHGRFLFWSWTTKSINFYFSTQSVALNEQIYATVRQAVIDKLGTNAKTFVAGIEI